VRRIHRKSINNYSPGNGNKHDSESLPEAYRRAGPYLNIGFVLAGSVLLFTWLGITLDHRWSTQPWLTVVGAFFGIFTGFYHFFKTIMSEQKKQQNQLDKHQDKK